MEHFYNAFWGMMAVGGSLLALVLLVILIAELTRR